MEIRKSSKMLHRLGSALSPFAVKKLGQTESEMVPPDVPKGYLAVYVGVMEECKRFVIPAVNINHPLFRTLLDKAEEKFGFRHEGPLLIPCDPLLFDNILCLLRNNSKAEIEQVIMELRK